MDIIAVWLWKYYLTLLCLRFLTCKMEVIPLKIIHSTWNIVHSQCWLLRLCIAISDEKQQLSFQMTLQQSQPVWPSTWLRNTVVCLWGYVNCALRPPSRFPSCPPPLVSYHHIHHNICSVKARILVYFIHYVVPQSRTVLDMQQVFNTYLQTVVLCIQVPLGISCVGIWECLGP